MKIKITKADKIFSQFIRLRDKQCVRCHSTVEFNSKGLPVSHENSHYFGRGQESTRIDPQNCDTLCFACHRIWGSDDKEAYRNFKIKQLGQNGFNMLLIKSKTIKKKDRKMNLLKAEILLKNLMEKTWK